MLTGAEQTQRLLSLVASQIDLALPLQQMPVVSRQVFQGNFFEVLPARSFDHQQSFIVDSGARNDNYHCYLFNYYNYYNFTFNNHFNNHILNDNHII